MELTIAPGAELSLAGSPAFGTDYTIASFEEAGRFLAGNEFGTVTLNGSPLTEGDDYAITYTPHAPHASGTGSIVINLVPEPASLALFALLALSLLNAWGGPRRNAGITRSTASSSISQD